MTPLPQRGLYVLTDLSVGRGTVLVAAVRAALRGGATMIQYRDKSGDTPRRLSEAEALLCACREFAVPLIINDDVELARETGADGVHLGRGDADPRATRERLGEAAIIGVSCYNEPARAVAAQAAGADYLAFGRFFTSGTKPQAVPASASMLRGARGVLARPIVAIGGITAANGGLLLEAGANLLAVVGAVIAQADVEAAARRFAPLFEATNANQEVAT